MAIQVQLAGLEDANLIIEALRDRAETLDAAGRQSMARRARTLADDFGDALDGEIPMPSALRRVCRDRKAVTR